VGATAERREMGAPRAAGAGVRRDKRSGRARGGTGGRRSGTKHGGGEAV